MNVQNQTTLAILAGGEGSRMNMPKAELLLKGQPILEHLLDQFPSAGERLLVTAPGRENPPGCRRFTREVTDPVEGQGPLRGVLTALEHLNTPFLIVLTVDMPGIRQEQLDWLLEMLRTHETALGLMSRRRGDGQPRVEPFPSIYRAQAAPLIARRLARERRSMHGLLEEPEFIAADVPSDWSERTWINLNAPTDLDGI